MLQSLFVCRRLLTGGTVIPVSLIAVVPTVLEKSVFYGYLAVASVSLGLPTQFVHCCLAATRAFMPASLIVIPYTILEISKFLGQLPVDDDDDDDDDEKCQLNASIASLRSELCAYIARVLGIHNVQMTSLRERPLLPSYFPSILSTFPIHVSWEPDQSYHVKMDPVVSLSW